MLMRIVNVTAILAVVGVWVIAAYVSAPLPRILPPKPERPVDAPVAKKPAAKPKNTPANYHAAALQAFEQTPGFGRGRMIITVESVKEIYVHWSPGELEVDGPAIEIPGLVKSHQERTKLLAKDRKQPTAPARVTSIHAGGAEIQWSLRSVDLIALVDHDQPVVYITAKLGNAAKHGADSDSSRGLDIFEMVALEKLRKGDEMFVRTKENTLRMVGALRATKSCLECHNAKEGDLFGAFSYTLNQNDN
jgi:hypothetical protein